MFSEYNVRVTFADVLPHEMFVCNGTLARKKTQRTGIIFYPAAPYRSFYYRQNDIVYIQKRDIKCLI